MFLRFAFFLASLALTCSLHPRGTSSNEQCHPVLTCKGPGFVYGTGYNGGLFKNTNQDKVTSPLRVQKSKVLHVASANSFAVLIRDRDQKAKFRGSVHVTARYYLDTETNEMKFHSFPDAKRVYGGGHFGEMGIGARIYYEAVNGSWYMATASDLSTPGKAPPPRHVDYLEGLDIKHVEVGHYHTLFLLANGSVAGDGCMDAFGLFAPDSAKPQCWWLSRTTKRRLECSCTEWKRQFALLRNHRPGWPMVNITTVAVGSGRGLRGPRSYFVKSDGTVYAHGENGMGGLGIVHRNLEDGSPDSGLIPPHAFNDSVVSVAVGDGHALFLTGKGHVFSVGANEHGQMGLGHNDQIFRNESWWLPGLVNIKEGYEHEFYPRRVPIENVRQVQAIGKSSYFVLCDGSVLATGRNANGELGVGDTQDRHTPVQVPSLQQVKCAAGGYQSKAMIYFLDKEL